MGLKGFNPKAEFPEAGALTPGNKNLTWGIFLMLGRMRLSSPWPFSFGHLFI